MAIGKQLKEQDRTILVPLMDEKEFADELKHSLMVLSTSSADKRDIYCSLFSSHDKETEGDLKHHAGVQFHSTDSGALGIVPRKTGEMTNSYKGNLYEKAYQQLELFRRKEVQREIRLMVKSKIHPEKDNPQFNIIGMTEDSGWSIAFDNDQQRQQFVDIITREITPKLRIPQDDWLIKKLYESGFPGVNLKPIQEHLEGGFHELMEMIYDAADEMKMKELRYEGYNNVSFVSPRLNKMFTKEFTMTGRLLTREEYEDRLQDTQRGEAINSNFVHVPDGQMPGRHETLDVLIQKGIHSKSSKELPASYTRRDVAEYLQDLIGKRRSSRPERDRVVRVAWVDPKAMESDEHVVEVKKLRMIRDLTNSKITVNDRLLQHPHLQPFHNSDVIVLIPEKTRAKNNRLRDDANYRMLLNFVVTAQTDPVSMSVPLVLDNRTGRFDKSLELISDAFAQGRLMGDKPFYVANDSDELESHLRLIKDIKQRAPYIERVLDTEETRLQTGPLEHVPNDGIYTVFIGGGHANNSKRDLEDASKLGYQCAENGWRIVTGAGSIEGSMGAIHTGFIQYHLDQLEKSEGNDYFKNALAGCLNAEGRYDAELAILEYSEVLEEMADAKPPLIPRGLFYGYSMQPLLEMESPSGGKPPGITYFDAGNRVRRLDALLAPGTKIFMHGGIGTDEEFVETIRQHVDARVRKKHHSEIMDGVVTYEAMLDPDQPADEKRAKIIEYAESMADHYVEKGEVNDPEFSKNTKKAAAQWFDQKTAGVQNDNIGKVDKAFYDGTPDDDGAIIIYNKDGRLDKLLNHYKILDDDPVAKGKRKMYNIKIVTSLDQLVEANKDRADTWLARTRKNAEDMGETRQMGA